VLDPPKLPQSLARFGHSAVAFNDKMYVFGGFDGVIHNDLFVYEPGMCIV
jgi:attractin